MKIFDKDNQNNEEKLLRYESYMHIGNIYQNRK